MPEFQSSKVVRRSKIPVLQGRVGEILGDDIAGRLVVVEERSDGISIRGWVAEGGRSGAKDVYLFLNGRPVRDKLLMHALTAAFGGNLARGEYPAAVLWLEIDPERVDVNVHPTKREVRFASGGAVHDFVMAVVRKARALVPTIAARTPTERPDVRAGVEASIQRYEQSRLLFERETRNARFETRIQGSNFRDQKLYEPRVASCESQVFDLTSRGSVVGSDLRVLGQFNSTYVICEGEGGTLVLIDQHAAHERLGFDSLCRSYAAGSVPRQALLVPESVELGPKALAYVMEHGDAISRAGFEAEPFGGSTLLVKAVPAILAGAAIAGLFDSLALELEDHGASDSLDEEVNRIFAVVACHSQVRAGDVLSHEELSALVREVEREGVTHCPHGRPAIVRIEKDEIEKWFRRR